MPKSFCSGKVIFQDVYDYTLEDVIFLLENREFSEFRFNSDKGYALIDSEAGEMQIEYKGSDNVIPEETVRRMLEVLEHIEECIETAHDWISSLDQKDDKSPPLNQGNWLPKLKETFEVNGINFGVAKGVSHNIFLAWNQYHSSHHQKNVADYFSIQFQHAEFTGDPYFTFNVKFDYMDMLPYEIELWIWCG